LLTFGLAGSHLARALFTFGLVDLLLAWVFFKLWLGPCLRLAWLAYILIGSCPLPYI